MQTGCNYWASHAAINMWLDWRPDIVRTDLEKLVALGIRTIRIFPVWRDFQPLEILYTAGNKPRELSLKSKRLPAEGPGRHGLDEVMLDRLGELLDIADSLSLRVHIPLVTGWMSGQMFVPPAFAGRELLTDSFAVFWELEMVCGIVERFRKHPAVASWSPGNETNCMQMGVSREQAALWIRNIADAVRSMDSSHPVIAGMHSLSPVPIGQFTDSAWTVQDCADIFDVLTVHPYPLFTKYCGLSRPDEFRNCFHAAAESTLYSTVGHRPCMVEEFGAFSPMFLGEEEKRNYLRASLWNSWTHGCTEFLWWCGCSHTFAHVPPYTWSALERELGLLDENGKAHEFASVIRDFRDALDAFPFNLPEAEPDAVCVLTAHQDSWANAFGCFLIAEQAGLKIRFVCAGEPLPESLLYFVPGISGDCGIYQIDYEELISKAKNGARVVFSCRDAVLSPSVRYWGFQTHFMEPDGSSVTVSGKDFSFVMERPVSYRVDAGESRVLAKAGDEPVMFEKQVGKGSIVLLTVPVEEYAASSQKAINRPDEFQAWRMYRDLAAGFVKDKPIRALRPKCTVSCHTLKDGSVIAVAVNNSAEDCVHPAEIREDWKLDKVYRGSFELVQQHDAAVFHLVREK